MQQHVMPDPDRRVVEQAYARWAPIYDAVCGPIFLQGRRAGARAARDVGGRILEIGIGTGLSFDDYDGTTEIVESISRSRWSTRRAGGLPASAIRM